MSRFILVHGDEENFTMKLVQQLLEKNVPSAGELVFQSEWTSQWGLYQYRVIRPRQPTKRELYSSPVHLFVVDGVWTQRIPWLKHIQSKEPTAPCLLVHDWPEFASPRYRRGANQGRITTLVGGYKKDPAYAGIEVYGGMKQSLNRILELLGKSALLRI